MSPQPYSTRDTFTTVVPRCHAVTALVTATVVGHTAQPLPHPDIVQDLFRPTPTHTVRKIMGDISSWQLSLKRSIEINPYTSTPAVRRTTSNNHDQQRSRPQRLRLVVTHGFSIWPSLPPPHPQDTFSRRQQFSALIPGASEPLTTPRNGLHIYL